MMSPVHPTIGSPCVGCDHQGRREFVRELAAIVAGVAGSLGISTVRAAALSMDFVSGQVGKQNEVTYPIPGQDGVTIDKEHETILVRFEQSVYAFSLSCPHQKTPLRWQEEKGRFECPKHKSTFKPDGEFIDGRATRNMDRFAIRKEGDNVLVDLAKLYREDQARESWIVAVVHL